MVSNYVKTPTNEVEVDQVTIRESAIEEFARRWGPEQTESEKKSDDDLFDTLMSSRSNSFRWKKQCPPPADQINNEFNQLSIDIDPNAWDLPASQVNSMMDAMLVNHTYAKEEEDDEEVENLNVNVTEANELVISTNQIDKSNGNISDDDENLMYLMLEPHLRPVTPEPNNYVSRTIFEEHKKLAKEYLKVLSNDSSSVILRCRRHNFSYRISLNDLSFFFSRRLICFQIQTEIAYVTKHKNELLMGMNEDVRQKRLDYCKKLQEKVLHLILFRWNVENLKSFNRIAGSSGATRSESKTTTSECRIDCCAWGTSFDLFTEHAKYAVDVCWIAIRSGRNHRCSDPKWNSHNDDDSKRWRWLDSRVVATTIGFTATTLIK